MIQVDFMDSLKREKQMEKGNKIKHYVSTYYAPNRSVMGDWRDNQKI